MRCDLLNAWAVVAVAQQLSKFSRWRLQRWGLAPCFSTRYWRSENGSCNTCTCLRPRHQHAVYSPRASSTLISCYELQQARHTPPPPLRFTLPASPSSAPSPLPSSAASPHRRRKPTPPLCACIWHCAARALSRRASLLLSPVLCSTSGEAAYPFSFLRVYCAAACTCTVRLASRKAAVLRVCVRLA